MTMSSAVSKVTLNGDGVQTAWPFSFKVWKAGDLEVSITSPNGTNTVATDWTVDLGASGGTVTYPITGYPLPTGWKITIRRSMGFLQEVDLVSGTRWDPEVVETALDQAAAERQQLLEEVRRSVKIGVASTEDPTQVVNQVFLARDQAAASAGAAATSKSNAATSEANAATSAAAAQTAADSIGILQDRGVLSTGQSVITLLWPYNPILRNVAVYLDGVKQDANTALIYTDKYTITLTAPVTKATNWEVISVTLAGDSILSGYVNQAQTIVNNAALSNLPVGSLIWVTGVNAPAGFVVGDGSLKSRVAFPDLWAFAQASGNISVDDASWTFGQYSPGDGSTTFRVPKVDDRFIRGKSDTRAVGLVEEDVSKVVIETIKSLETTNVVPSWWTDTARLSPGCKYGSTQTGSQIHGGTETRPKALTMLPCIKAYDVISDPNVLNAVAVVNSIADVTARVTPCLSTDEYMHVRDEKPSGAAGGSASAATWHTRDLNTEKTNTIMGASLDTNRITLPAGKYYISASAPGAAVTRHRAGLYNVNTGIFVLLGTSTHTPSSGGDSSRSFANGVIDVPIGTTFEVRHYCDTAYATNGLGFPVTISGQNEIYSEVEIWKIG